MTTPHKTISREDLLAEIDERFLKAVGITSFTNNYKVALQLLEIRKNIPTDSDIIK